jgi:hypothetical protein
MPRIFTVLAVSVIGRPLFLSCAYLYRRRMCAQLDMNAVD